MDNALPQRRGPRPPRHRGGVWCGCVCGGVCRRGAGGFREGGSLGCKYFWFSMHRYRQELGCDNAMNTTCTTNANIAFKYYYYYYYYYYYILIVTQSTTAAGVVQIRYY